MIDLREAIGKAIAASAREIFDSMIMIDVEEVPVESYMLQNFESNLTSILGLGGDIRGSLDLHFPESVALKLTSQFLGMEVGELDEDVKDAMGELANMIAGGLKDFFSANDIVAQLSIPSTVVGKSYRTRSLEGTDRVTVALRCGAGLFLADLKYVLKR